MIIVDMIACTLLTVLAYRFGVIVGELYEIL
jgi:hypothetical protein